MKLTNKQVEILDDFDLSLEAIEAFAIIDVMDIEYLQGLLNALRRTVEEGCRDGLVEEGEEGEGH